MMMGLSHNTVAAIATARGQGGVAIVRLSGPASWAIARRLFSRRDIAFEPGRFYHGWILDPASPPDAPVYVDEVLLLIFQGPKSFTGEDVVEIHCHGGDFLSRKVLELCLQAGAEPAPPGEFTKRAFLSGRIDLTQAESILDLVSAQGERLLGLAAANLKNRSLTTLLTGLGETLIAVQAPIVASVDFPDEVEEPDRPALQAQLAGVLQQADALEAASRHNRMVREGFNVALLGRPNAGKSSLFNALLMSERAIVTSIPGTTRDVLTETLTLQGVPVTLFDTAGIRETAQTVELLGIERTWQASESAHGLFYLVDATVGLTAEDTQHLDALRRRVPDLPIQLIANKIDLLPAGARLPEDALGVSVHTGAGIPELFQHLEGLLAHQTGDDALSISLNRRQLACLQAMRANVAEACEALAAPRLPIDLVTVPLTEALRQLDALMGRDTAEDVLTSVFHQFCVGK